MRRALFPCLLFFAATTAHAQSASDFQLPPDPDATPTARPQAQGPIDLEGENRSAPRVILPPTATPTPTVTPRPTPSERASETPRPQPSATRSARPNLPTSDAPVSTREVLAEPAPRAGAPARSTAERPEAERSATPTDSTVIETGTGEPAPEPDAALPANVLPETVPDDTAQPVDAFGASSDNEGTPGWLWGALMAGLALLLGAIILFAATMGFIVGWTGVADAIGGVAVLMSAFALGWAVRSQHDARERGLEQVKSEERVLLARELHDTVAHHVSAIAVQAQAGRALAATSPSSPLEALEVIEAEASRTLAEMRAMVRVLRNKAPANYAPQPGVVDLERLSGASPTGPRVKVTVTGDLAALPRAVDAAVFRIAQEGVTNALRHARNATLVDVRVAGDQSTVSVTVRDDGDAGPGDPDPDAGFGLAGMVERALLVGGKCRAGPCPGGGWAVVATLPRRVPT